MNIADVNIVNNNSMKHRALFMKMEIKFMFIVQRNTIPIRNSDDAERFVSLNNDFFCLFQFSICYLYQSVMKNERRLFLFDSIELKVIIKIDLIDSFTYRLSFDDK